MQIVLIRGFKNKGDFIIIAEINQVGFQLKWEITTTLFRRVCCYLYCYKKDIGCLIVSVLSLKQAKPTGQI